MSEQWADVEGYEGLYEVSTEGRVRGIRRPILRPDQSARGDQRVVLCSQLGHKRKCTVHRLVAAAFIGRAPVGYEVNHIDGNPRNNRRENLEYVTRSQNMRHSYDVLHRQPPHMGERTHFAKLTDNDVIQIRRLRKQGRTYAEIAAQFNTKPANVWHICIGRTWKHLL